jgi:ribonuclease T2
MNNGVFLKPSKLGMLSLSMLVFGFYTPKVQANNVNGYMMAVQMTPAVCYLDNSKVKKRKCLEGYSLNIKGLYPETSKTDCKSTSSAALSPIQAKVVARVMPDDVARQQLWANYGGCTPMNASQYFRTIINYADRLKIPSALTGQQTSVVQLNSLRSNFVRLNSGLAANGIHFQCTKQSKSIYLTEIKVCYSANGKYKSCPSDVVTNCPSSFTIKGSY